MTNAENFFNSNKPYSVARYEYLVSMLDIQKSGISHVDNGPYGLFHVFNVAPITEKGDRIKGVVVAHELCWHGGYHEFSDSYQSCHEKYGINMKFVSSECSRLLHRTLVRFDFVDSSKNALLIIPATGEEIYLDIYGITGYGHEVLIPIFEGEG